VRDFWSFEFHSCEGLESEIEGKCCAGIVTETLSANQLRLELESGYALYLERLNGIAC
jgi:hypothetical protein